MTHALHHAVCAGGLFLAGRARRRSLARHAYLLAALAAAWRCHLHHHRVRA